MKTASDSKPAVYVGTYAKYNNGNLDGAWLNLEDYPDRDAFLQACAELHQDESDPEFMFQDFQCFPREFYGESYLPETLWAWLDLDDDDRELLSVYSNWICDKNATIEDARDKFQGKFRSREDWAEQYADDTGLLSSVPENLRAYFDMDAFARDCEIGGDMAFIEHDGEVWAFSNH